MPEGNKYPFGEFLGEKRPVYGSFFEVNRLKEDPRYVVKEFFDPGGSGGKQWMKRVIDDIRLVQRNFADFTPKTELVIGEGKTSAPTLFLVQERIEGEPIDPERPVSAENLATLDRFACQLARTYGGTYAPEAGRGAVPEVPYPDRGNILLGKATARSEETERPYLIDFYPLLRLEPVEFQEMMRRWIAYLEDMQERIEGGWQLVPLAARRVFEDVLLDIYRRQH